MISNRHRFHGYGGLNYVYRKGKTTRFGTISLRYCPNPRRKYSRIAVVVSKKVAKKAVDRNRIRRRLYEIIRLNIPKIKNPHDIVFTVFDKQTINIEHSELESTVTELLKKSKIIT